MPKRQTPIALKSEENILKKTRRRRTVTAESSPRTMAESHVSQWYKEFLDSKHYSRLPEKLRREMPFATYVSKVYLFETMRGDLTEVRPFQVERMLIEQIPREVTVDDVESFVGAMVEWFVFLAQQSKLLHRRSIEQTVRSLRDRAVEAMTSQANFSKTKRFLLSALNDGLDLEDERGLLEYAVAGGAEENDAQTQIQIPYPIFYNGVVHNVLDWPPPRD